MAASVVPGTLDDLRSRFDRAAGRLGVEERRFNLAGLAIRFRFAGGELEAETTQAFEHLSDENGIHELVVNCWSVDSDDTRPDMRPQILNHPVVMSDLRLNAPDIRAQWNPEAEFAVVFDRQSQQAWRWLHAGGMLPWWERASPLRALLFWYLDQYDLTFMHGAAVADGGHAALLVGPGGSGKSSTALACLLDGMDYLGDDYCVASSGEDPHAYCLYGSAKVRPDGIAGFEQFLEHANTPGGADGEKLVVWPSRAFPDRIARSAQIRTVIAPTVAGHGPTRLTKLSSAGALAALAPSSILQIPGAGQNALRHMSRILGQVSCWRLELGADRAAVPDAVREALEASEDPR